MVVLVDGVAAVLPESFAFEYVVENADFSGADGFSTEIEFPMRDCVVNLGIFGRLNRMDVDFGQVRFDCRLIDGCVCIDGVLVLTDVSETSIKMQFLSGLSVQNYETDLSDVRINDLSLGSPGEDELVSSSPSNLANELTGDYVALPWYNSNAESDHLQNACGNVGGVWYRIADTRLSYQPRMLFIAKRICEAIGYSYDFGEWESSDWRFLIVCNALPAAWEMPQWEYALPAWSVEEFFEQLGYLLDGYFVIDNIGKRVCFSFRRSLCLDAGEAFVEDVVDAFETEVDEDKEHEHISECEIGYSDSSHAKWKYYCCDFMVGLEEDAFGIDFLEFDTLDGLVGYARNYDLIETRSEAYMVHCLLYARDVDTYYMFRVDGCEVDEDDEEYCSLRLRLEALNIFGKRNYVREDSSVRRREICLNIVPVCLNDTDLGRGACIHLDFSSYDEANRIEVEYPAVDSRLELSKYEDWSTRTSLLIDRGERLHNYAYFDKLYVAFWQEPLLGNAHMPCPFTDNQFVSDDFMVDRCVPFSDLNLRLRGRYENVGFSGIDHSRLYKFSFLCKRLLNARSIFVIRGQRYVCVKLVYSFNDCGMSEIVKGEFYRCV